MKKHVFAPIITLALAGVVGGIPAPSPSPSPSPAPAAAPVAVQAASAQAAASLATVKEFCAGCHNDRVKTSGVSFDALTVDNVAQHAEVLEKAVRKLRGRVMPPPGSKQPDAKAIDGLVAWLETSLDRAAASKDHITDKGILHRLNREEYSNAVRDLLAVEYDASRVLPEDDTVEGYDNIAEALQVSPSFIEQYVIAARNVAIKALGRPNARAEGWTFRAEPGSQLTHVDGLPLGTRGGVLGKVDLPADGEYVVNIPDLATAIWGNGLEYENPLVVTLDNKIIYEALIGGEADNKDYDQVFNGALDRVNARLKNIKFTTTAGPHKIGVTFRRKSFAESDDQVQMMTPGGGQDRLYRIPSFQLQGPFNPSGLSATPSRDRIFVCHPEKGAVADACAKQILETLSRRAYRRPVTDQDVNELLAYYNDGKKEGGFEGGIRSAITGMLASPFFLYRAERVPANLKPGDSYAISDLELASKLSFFLWSSIPDDELLDLAINRKLNDAATLDKQVARMLADPRSEKLAANFVHQWLNMKRLNDIVPDNDVFPYASGRSDPREAFRTELTLFADSIFRENRSVVDLLSANYTFLNERLALHYGINDVKGDLFRRVELKDTSRFGLLGKGAVLMAAAYPNRTSPVLRGAFILKYLQGVPPPNPPAVVPSLDEKDIGTTKALTVREMMAKHRSQPACNSCHAIMDPLGFALENFDATGRWRDRDRYAGVEIDSAGVLPDGTAINGPDDLRKALLRRPDQFVQTFTEGLLTYASGRTLHYYDMPTVRNIVRSSASGNYKFSALVQSVVRSDQFRMRRAPEPAAAADSKSVN